MSEKERHLRLYRPGAHGCHEALDRAHLLGQMVEIALCEHPAIEANEAWRELAGRAADALHELYHAIAAEHLPAAEKREREP